MKNILILGLLIAAFSSCSEKKVLIKDDFIITNGQMSNMVMDKDNSIHLIYGSGDSIFYSWSADNASSFSKPSLIAALPDAYTFAMRGPQIAATKNGIVVTACTAAGNIYPFYKEADGNWVKGNKVNDVDTVAKEGLMALSADGDNVFAVWLDLRENKRNKIYGARSRDGGKSWSKNVMVYTSPDTTVCECCKPSVVIKENNVYVMFRNFLHGNRDLYLIKSNDNGNTFNKAEKLGTRNWKLNGCPMDGGGLVVNKDGGIQTVWRREGKIFAAVPGVPEKEIGEGKGCTIETVNNKNVYAWTEKGEIVLLTPNAQKKILGKGSLPVLKALNDEHVICVWENEHQIHAAILEL